MIVKYYVALLTESVDWNNKRKASCYDTMASLSSRRAWIEISLSFWPRHPRNVALLTESVDWNASIVIVNFTMSWSLSSRRAWIEMQQIHWQDDYIHSSLSSRRAWIEIPSIVTFCAIYGVALLTESVDWNCFSCLDSSRSHMSLSSRRAWIEIYCWFWFWKKCWCRSPHGERGLKYLLC